MVEMSNRISHVIADESICANIKSRREPKKRCANIAVHGEYCGIHYKHPRPWSPGSPKSTIAHVKLKYDNIELIDKIKKWWRFNHGLQMYRNRGPAYWVRSLCTNDCDFFSTDNVTDISGFTFYSYKDSDNHIYGFDIRSIHTLLYRARTASEAALNPFTRLAFPKIVNKQVSNIVRLLNYHRISTEWAPLTPPTPEQQLRMKIVDIFSKIDELNYYSSPDWFIHLDIDDHKEFYGLLFDIWTTRANLSNAQKNTIVPGYTSKLFKTPRWAVADMTLEGLQRMNLNTMRTMISSAIDRNDRILGAMYVVSALTLVCDEARAAYPWLYESVFEEAPPRAAAEERRPALANLLGIGWLNDILALREALEAAPAAPPPLALPPPARLPDGT